MHVESEPPEARNAVGKIELIAGFWIVFETLFLGIRHDAENEVFTDLRRQARRLKKQDHFSLNPQRRMEPSNEMEIRSLPFHGDFQKLVKSHMRCMIGLIWFLSRRDFCRVRGLSARRVQRSKMVY